MTSPLSWADTSYQKIMRNNDSRHGSLGCLDIERLQSIEAWQGFMNWNIVRRKTKPRKSCEEKRNGDLCLCACQRRSYTKMNTTAEGRMTLIGTFDIEFLRVLVH